MQEEKILCSFPNCPQCGSSDTIAQRAAAPLKESGKIPQDARCQLRVVMTPLEQPMLASVAVQCLVAYYDVCAGCGLERCTRAALQNAIIQGQITGGDGGRQAYQRGR